jgi:4-amino-4-deoxy-L-arabinose transferase-like glycosyltransferase
MQRLSDLLRSPNTTIAACVFLLSLLLGTAWWIHSKPVTPYSDFQEYYALAQGLAANGHFGHPEPTARRLPLYPAFLSLLIRISPSVAWLNYANVVLNSLLVVLIYFLTLRVCDRREIAAIAAALCAVCPTFVYLSPVLAAEHLFAPLLFGAILVLVADHPRSWVRASVAGALLGLSALTRGEAAFYLPVLLILVWLNKGSIFHRLTAGGLLIVLFTAVLTPWYVRNERVVGKGAGLTTLSGVNFYYAHNPNRYGWHRLTGHPWWGLDEVTLHRTAREYAIRHLKEEPGGIVTDMKWGTVLLLVRPATYSLYSTLIVPGGDVAGAKPRKDYPPGSRGLVRYFYYGIVLLAFASIFLWSRRGVVFPLLLLVVMNWVCFAVIFFGKPRYRYTSEIVFCILSAIVIGTLWSWMREWVTRQRLDSRS